MSLIDRATTILVSPKIEWKKIDKEAATIGGLFAGYAATLALLPVIGTLLAVLMSPGPYRFGFNEFPVSSLAGYAIGLGGLYLMGIIVNALASGFDGQRSDIGAMKLVVYSATAIWVTGFFFFIPILGPLIGLTGFGYMAYLLYLGSQSVMNVPESRAIGYTAVTIIISIVLGIIIGVVFGDTAALTGAAALS